MRKSLFAALALAINPRPFMGGLFHPATAVPLVTGALDGRGLEIVEISNGMLSSVTEGVFIAFQFALPGEAEISSGLSAMIQGN